jgi:hypothetical protein
MARLFTLEEANQVVTRIRPIIAQIMEIRREVMEKRPEIWAFLVKTAGNGGNKMASQVDYNFQLLQTLIHKIIDTGAEIKDIDSGLVDFHSLRDGQEILLCWKYNEDQIQFWHNLDAGFAGRQKL